MIKLARFACFSLLLLAVGTPLFAALPSRPNVVFFLVDDLGWRDSAASAARFTKRRNIDRLAATGMRFTQAYAACPVCSPTRASILTGKYPQRLGLTDYIAANGRISPKNGGGRHGSCRPLRRPHAAGRSHTGRGTQSRPVMPHFSPASGTWARRGFIPRTRASTLTRGAASGVRRAAVSVTSRPTAIPASRRSAG